MTYDGRVAWEAVPDTDRPFPILALVGDDLEAAKLEAELSFPGGIEQSLDRWRVGTPVTIDDRDVDMVQGINRRGLPMKLYFDRKSGFLVRVMRYTDLTLGRIPTRIDYRDYREVSGVKMPFHWRVQWTDGEVNFDVTDIRVNVPVDAAKFARPSQPGRSAVKPAAP
jgi:hypothetical protein